MADTTREKKLADALVKHLDTIELNAHWVVFSLSDKGTAIQQRMYELCMGFFTQWAWRYQKGEINSNQILYPICRSSHIMLEALAADAEKVVPDQLPEIVSSTTQAWRDLANEGK